MKSCFLQIKAVLLANLHGATVSYHSRLVCLKIDMKYVYRYLPTYRYFTYGCGTVPVPGIKQYSSQLKWSNFLNKAVPVPRYPLRDCHSWIENCNGTVRYRYLPTHRYFTISP